MDVTYLRYKRRLSVRLRPAFWVALLSAAIWAGILYLIFG